MNKSQAKRRDIAAARSEITATNGEMISDQRERQGWGNTCRFRRSQRAAVVGRIAEARELLNRKAACASSHLGGHAGNAVEKDPLAVAAQESVGRFSTRNTLAGQADRHALNGKWGLRTKILWGLQRPKNDGGALGHRGWGVVEP